MSEPTPGPWKYGHRGFDALWVGPDYDQAPTAIVPWDCRGARDSAREDARLIAAAPDMLDLLQEISRLDEEITTNLPWEMILRIRAAIAKATNA